MASVLRSGHRYIQYYLALVGVDMVGLNECCLLNYFLKAFNKHQHLSVFSLRWTCRNCSALVLINEVNLHRARLVLGWVTVSGFDSRDRHFILVCNQPPRSTQPSTLAPCDGKMSTVPAKGR